MSALRPVFLYFFVYIVIENFIFVNLRVTFWKKV